MSTKWNNEVIAAVNQNVGESHISVSYTENVNSNDPSERYGELKFGFSDRSNGFTTTVISLNWFPKNPRELEKLGIELINLAKIAES